MRRDESLVPVSRRREPLVPVVRLGIKLTALVATALTLAVLAPALAQTHAQAQTQSQAPGPYVARIQLDTQRCGPFCRVALPPEIYRYSAATDLSDLRVVDADGKVQPYARYASAREVQATGPERLLPVYPVTAPARSTLPPGVRLRMDRAPDGGMRFELDSADAAAPARPPGAVAGAAGAQVVAPVIAYVIDARALDAPAAGLRLEATFPAGRLVPLTIERSRDLANWERLASEPVYRLDGAGTTLERSSVRFRTPVTLRDSFLRVSWPADVAFELRNAHALFDSFTPPARVAVELTQAAADARSVEWNLPSPAGWEALELRPAGHNALLPLTLQARRTSSDPWVNVGRGVVYRIGGTDGGAESVSPPLATTGGAYRRLRAVVGAAAPPLDTPPKARLLYAAEEVVFLVQGRPPFALVTGHPKPAPAGAALPLGALLPDYKPGAESKLPLATLAGVEVDAARAAPAPTWAGHDVRTIGLWVVLVAAVLLLSLFAYSLLRKLRAAPAANGPRARDADDGADDAAAGAGTANDRSDRQPG